MFFDPVILLYSLLLCLPVYSIPLGARQANNSPLPAARVSVTTVVFPTATCVSTFTPTQDGGKDVIVEVDSCVVLKDPLPSDQSSTRITSTTTSSTALPSTTTTTLTVTSGSTALPSTTTTTLTVTLPPTSASSSTSSASSSTTSASSPTTSASSPAISSSPEIPSPSSTTSSILSPSAVNSPLPDDPDIPTILGTSSISVEPSAVGVSGVAAGSSMPGKKFSVLPIGLGVFAGISVIALIVVGLVTYERTKYRKAFRQRKLAEAGAPMGYGGMY